MIQVFLSAKVTFLIMEVSFMLYIYYILRLTSAGNVTAWISKGLSTENFVTPTTSNNSLSATVKWYEDSNFCLVFIGSCLKQGKASLTPLNIINFFLSMN